MERDEVLRLARQAWQETGEGWTDDAWFDGRAASFERFAALVAAAERAKMPPAPMVINNPDVVAVVAVAVAAEREACKKDAEACHVAGGTAIDVIEAIRARGGEQRCAECRYQHGHAIGCANNPVDAAIRARK